MPNRFDKNIYDELILAYKEGSINLLIQRFAENWQNLLGLLPEIIEYINSVSVSCFDISPKTKEALASLPYDVRSKLKRFSSKTQI